MERRAIRIAFDEGQRASCFDAETGEQLLNVYRIELLFDRSKSQARVVFGEPEFRSDGLIVTRSTSTDVFDVVAADCTFSGKAFQGTYGPAWPSYGEATLALSDAEADELVSKYLDATSMKAGV